MGKTTEMKEGYQTLPPVEWPVNICLELAEEEPEPSEIRTVWEYEDALALSEAKNEDARKTIADLLAQVESLQIANENICTGDDSLRERFQNLQEANKSLIIQNDVLRKEKQIILEKRLDAAQEVSNACVTIHKQLKKIRKLKKKNKHLLRALSC